MSGLPSAARAKLSKLSALADDAAVLANGALGQVKAAEARLNAVLHEIDTATAPPRIDTLKAEASALTEEIERLRGIMGERQARAAEATKLVVRLRNWADRLPPHMMFSMAPVEYEAGEGGPRGAVERCRAVIKELRGQVDATRRAPLTRPEVKRFVSSWITQHAARGRPRIVVDHDRADVAFENARALVPGDRFNAPASADLFIWLFRDELAEAMEREVDAMTLETPLSREEKAERLATLRAQLLAAERAEEAAIVAAGEEGMIVTRRNDADALAVLGIQIVGANDARAA